MGAGSWVKGQGSIRLCSGTCPDLQELILTFPECPFHEKWALSLFYGSIRLGVSAAKTLWGLRIHMKPNLAFRLFRRRRHERTNGFEDGLNFSIMLPDFPLQGFQLMR